MCSRERILTSRSSLITYTAEEFVYAIIFSLTASPRAAAFQRCGHEEGALLLPRTKPSSAPKPWYKLCAETPPPALPTPGLGFASHLQQGHPWSSQTPGAPHSRRDVSCSTSEGYTGVKSSPWCCPAAAQSFPTSRQL